MKHWRCLKHCADINSLNLQHPFQGRQAEGNTGKAQSRGSQSSAPRMRKQRQTPLRGQGARRQAAQDANGKLLLGIKGKKQLLQKGWSHNGTSCSILGAIQELLGKGPSNLSWLLNCIYNKESSAVTGLNHTSSPLTLIYSMIWSHFPPHIQESTIRDQEMEASAVERGDTFLPQRLSKASAAHPKTHPEAASAAHPKFFVLFNACCILYPLRER